MAARSPDRLLFRYRDSDNRHGVSRRTVERLASELGMNETQVIHYALKQLATNVLPSYEPDGGPFTQKDVQAIQRRAGRPRGKSVGSTLI